MSKEVRTIEELVKALPEGVTLHPDLSANLAQLDLMLSGKVVITGVENGRVIAENTEKGREEVLERFLHSLHRKGV